MHFYITKGSATAKLQRPLDLSFPVVGLLLSGSAGCASALESSSGLRGYPPRLLTPWGVIAWRLRQPK